VAKVFPEAAVLLPEDIRTGLTAQFERDITEEDIFAFSHLSGDANPLHVDPVYAAESNYGARIVHGAFQIGLASAMIGMHLPGRNVLLGSVSARFPKPLYYPAHVLVSATVVGWSLGTRSGTLRVTVVDTGNQVPTAEIHLSFTLHEQQSASEASVPVRESATGSGDRKTVLVTGASGGIGGELIADLARDYRVLALSRRHAVAEAPHVVPLTSDLDDAGLSIAVEGALGGNPLFAVIHAAWPGQPTGGLLDTPPDVLKEQVGFATSQTVTLARILAQHAATEAGGRLIALGSIVGTHKPVLTYSAYSLGKAALEQTVRLLAPELGRKKITANVISPSFVPTGMNRQSTERQRLKETALVPMGRLCQPSDIMSIVRYLLSPDAAFVSGQTIVLSGGQL
jgi:3-oxoacyl-[acyl-carrier protein] reductase